MQNKILKLIGVGLLFLMTIIIEIGFVTPILISSQLPMEILIPSWFINIFLFFYILIKIYLYAFKIMKY